MRHFRGQGHRGEDGHQIARNRPDADANDKDAGQRRFFGAAIDLIGITRSLPRGQTPW